MALPVRQQDGSDTDRQDPFADLQQLGSQLSRFFGGWGDAASLLGGEFTPLADIEETDDAYVLELDVPGVKKDDIEVSISGRRLTIDGEIKQREKVGIVRRRTRPVGRFHYEVALPGEIDDDNVKATLDDGVLTLWVPKKASDRPRRIGIK